MILRRVLAFFLPAAAALTIAAGLAYAAVQQDLRSGANDPEQQLAEDAATGLNAGVSPGALGAGTNVDIATSLSPFVAVYDVSGRVVASAGLLDGQPPAPSAGVLASAQSSGIDKVTWQPKAGVRIALVVLPWKGGSVLAGRSLRLVEEREGAIEELALLVWLLGLVALAVASLIAGRLWPDPPVLPGAREPGVHAARDMYMREPRASLAEA